MRYSLFLSSMSHQDQNNCLVSSSTSQILGKLPPISLLNQEYKASEPHQSDFIKRIKRTKSIMMANKNRKQKYVLKQYYVDKPTLKKEVSSRSKKEKEISHSPLVNRYVPVHKSRMKTQSQHINTSVQISYGQKKEKLLKKLDFLMYQPVDLGAYLLSLTNKCSKKNLLAKDPKGEENSPSPPRYVRPLRITATGFSEKLESKSFKSVKNNLDRKKLLKRTIVDIKNEQKWKIDEWEREEQYKDNEFDFQKPF